MNKVDNSALLYVKSRTSATTFISPTEPQFNMEDTSLKEYLESLLDGFVVYDGDVLINLDFYVGSRKYKEKKPFEEYALKAIHDLNLVDTNHTVVVRSELHVPTRMVHGVHKTRLRVSSDDIAYAFSDVTTPQTIIEIVRLA